MAASYTTPVSFAGSPDAVPISIIKQRRYTTYTIYVTVATIRYVHAVETSLKRGLQAAKHVLRTVGPAFLPLIVMRTAGGIPYYVVNNLDYIPPVGWSGVWNPP